VSRESDYRAQFTELIEAYAGPVRRLCSAYASTTADRDGAATGRKIDRRRVRIEQLLSDLT